MHAAALANSANSFAINFYGYLWATCVLSVNSISIYLPFTLLKYLSNICSTDLADSMEMETCFGCHSCVNQIIIKVQCLCGGITTRILWIARTNCLTWKINKNNENLTMFPTFIIFSEEKENCFFCLLVFFLGRSFLCTSASFRYISGSPVDSETWERKLLSSQRRFCALLLSTRKK